MKRLIKSYYDFNIRDAAITYIDGEILEDRTHAHAISRYLNDRGLGQLNDNWYRPGLWNDENDLLFKEIKDVKLVKDNINSIAFTHRVDSKNGIFIDTSKLYNIDLNTVVNALRTKYKNYKIYDDNNWNPETLKFKQIAHNKRLIQGIDAISITNPNGEFIIYENPTSDEILTLKRSNPYNSIRGVIYDNGAIYIWNGDELLYKDVEHLISISQFRFSVDNGSWLIDAHNRYTQNELIQLINKYKDILSEFGNLYTKWEFFRIKDGDYYDTLDPKFIFEKNTISRLKTGNEKMLEVSMSPISPLYPGYYAEDQEDQEDQEKELKNDQENNKIDEKLIKSEIYDAQNDKNGNYIEVFKNPNQDEIDIIKKQHRCIRGVIDQMEKNIFGMDI